MICAQQSFSYFNYQQNFTHNSCFYSQQNQPQSPPPCSPEAAFDDLVIVKKINKANFLVFLTYSPSLNLFFAMKVFPYQKDGTIRPNFMNEIRFAHLQHPNVISIVEYQAQKTVSIGDSNKDISFTLMELAPYGDFFDMIMTHQVKFDDILARTYFHQLINGLEYLHSQGVAHLDIKLENLLVGEGFQLKIADFDNACVNGQSYTTGRGTTFYRAPELMNDNCQDGYAADIYSSAVILFLMKSGGVLPHAENKTYKGMNLLHMLNFDNELFWQKHCELQERPYDYFDEDFKALFNAMVTLNPEERATIADIKNSYWYNGPVYSPEELNYLMNQLYHYKL